ncbi:MAG: hypothetical protein MI923_12900 [Phycisphaerales bacterium]|nr:hypothetical protein [Phycisphaerales bacterium]
MQACLTIFPLTDPRVLTADAGWLRSAASRADHNWTSRSRSESPDAHTLHFSTTP